MQWVQIGKVSLERDHPQRVAYCQLSWKNFHLAEWSKFAQVLFLLLYQQMACSTFGEKELLGTSIHLTESRAQRPLILLTFSFLRRDLRLYCQEVVLVTHGDRMIVGN